MEGLRYNEGKRRWGLLSWPALSELVKVLEFGARKYDSWNWSKGLSWSECFESLQRHATAWYCGEDRDPETGLSHMAHVLCNAMFLVHFIVMGGGKDDRPSALDARQPGKEEKQKELNDRAQVNTKSYTAYATDAVVERGVSDVQEDVRQKGRHDDYAGCY